LAISRSGAETAKLTGLANVGEGGVPSAAASGKQGSKNTPALNKTLRRLVIVLSSFSNFLGPSPACRKSSCGQQIVR
jgi:hypothetical protein